MDKVFVRPIKRFVLLLDEQPDRTENGVAVHDSLHLCTRHDFVVVRVGEREDCEIGQGDIVVLDKVDAGRRLSLDGVVYRLVRLSDIIAVISGVER